MPEVYFNNFQTTVAPGGYTAGSNILNVLSTSGITLSAGETTRLTLYTGSPEIAVILIVTTINSSTQFAVTAEGADVNASANDLVLNTLTVGGMNQIRADINSTGIYADLPTLALKSGIEYHATDVDFDFVYNGSLWVPFFRPSGQQVTLPINSNYAWVNQQTNTLVNNASVLINFPNQSSINLGARSRAISGFTTIDLGVRAPVWASASDQLWYGIGFMNSGSGKLITFSILYNGNYQLDISQWNSPTSFNTSVTHSDYRGGPFVYLRIKDDGVTDRFYYLSVDGQNWTLIYSESRTTFLTADTYIIHGLNFGTFASSLPVEYFHIVESNA